MARILVIDDEEMIRQLLVDSLSALGHDVAEAINGTQGLAHVESFAPDLVITDILMPDADGIEFLTALRRNAKGTKVIAMSGGGMSDAGTFLHTARALGACAALTKPFSMSALQQEIADALEE